MNTNILVVDDERLIRWSLCERLKEEGYTGVPAEDGTTALHLLGEQDFGLALLDFRLPDMNGLDLLRKAREEAPGLPIILVTAYSTVDNAVEAMRAGAFDYITKPFNMDELVLVVKRALGADPPQRRSSDRNGQETQRFGVSSIVGESPASVRIRHLARKVADSNATTILLLGESGTGKDVLARAIHYESNRVDMPFMNITCTALPETLLDSELFGYEKGAFTDAKEQKKGLFELADGGTVFLDEIGDMTPALQAKLLRVLEEKSFKRIGGRIDIAIDVRIIAATNRDLEKAIHTETFRPDLFYRLSTVPIVLPPLRHREEDIPALAKHFLEQFGREHGHSFKEIPEDTVDKLCAYNWPGNIRELRNVIERAVLFSSGNTIAAEDVLLGRSVLGAAAEDNEYLVQLPKKGCCLTDIERDLLRQALDRTQWNQTQAGRLLGLTRDQIRYKVEKYDLVAPDSPQAP
jgi:two-component system, NtrC family, response regulator AtoC